MKTTIILIGHSGVGKSPLENIFKPAVKISAPLRVRDKPRDEKDIFYIPQQARDILKNLNREKVLAVSGDIEVYPSVIFFPVRGSDQVALNHTNDPQEYVKYEIFAPVYYDLFFTPAVREYYPFLTGGLYHRGLELIRDQFAERTWGAFWRVVVDGRAAADVADEMGLSVNSVYLAKSRVLRRLREELGELLD